MIKWINNRDAGKVAIKQLLKGTKKLHTHSPPVSNNMGIMSHSKAVFHFFIVTKKTRTMGIRKHHLQTYSDV